MPEERYSQLERQLRATQDELERVYEERDGLQARVVELDSKIQLAEGNDVKYLLAKYILQRTPDNRGTIAVTGSNGRTKKDEIDFEKWQKGIEGHYKKKIAILHQESGGLRKVLFRTRMDLFMKSHPEFAEVPFAYCDVNRQLLCTPSVYHLFAIEPGKELDLGDLLGHIEREDAKYIFKSFKKGVSLKDYKLRDARSISINTYPLFYSELPVGVAMILQSPELKVEPGKIFRFVRGILNEVKSMSEEYGILKQKSNSSATNPEPVSS